MMASEVLTIGEAAERLNRPGQWLRRHLLARERATGRTILVRVGAGKRPRYRVSMAALRASCPELFDVRDPIAAAVQESAIVGRREMTELKNVMHEIACNVDALSEAIRRVSNAINGPRRPPASGRGR